MARPVVTVRADGRVVCERCLVADRPWARMRGLLGRSELPRGEGVLLRPAGSIHTLFMRFAIDAVFLDRDDRVLGVAANVRPWRFASRRRARSVLELAAGEASRLGLSPDATLDFGDEGALQAGSSTSPGTDRGDAATPVPEGGMT